MAGLMAQASSVKPNPLAASTTKSLAVPAADLPKVVEAIEAQFPSAKLHAVVMENAGYMPDGETPACPFAAIQEFPNGTATYWTKKQTLVLAGAMCALQIP